MLKHHHTCRLNYTTACCTASFNLDHLIKVNSCYILISVCHMVVKRALQPKEACKRTKNYPSQKPWAFINLTAQCAANTTEQTRMLRVARGDAKQEWTHCFCDYQSCWSDENQPKSKFWIYFNMVMAWCVFCRLRISKGKTEDKYLPTIMRLK